MVKPNRGSYGTASKHRAVRKERPSFTTEERRKLWKSYEEGNRDAAIPLIMIYTGMSAAEMLNLSTEMIDLEAKTINGVGLNEKSVVNSYWDAELSKLDTSAGGTGMSTQKMMTMSSFAGWDTLGYWMYDRCEEGQCEIKNWDDGCYCKKAFVKFWAIDEGKSYPYLNKNLDLIDYQWSEYLRSVDNPEQPPVRIQNQTLAKSRSFGAKFDGGLVALRFEIPTAGAVKFSLVDMQGRVVKSADLGHRATGSHFETLNVENIARGRYVGVLRVNGKSNGNVVLQK